MVLLLKMRGNVLPDGPTEGLNVLSFGLSGLSLHNSLRCLSSLKASLLTVKKNSMLFKSLQSKR